MPIYTFVCPKCKEKLTGNFPMSQSDGKEVVCPKCGHKGLRRIFEQFFSPRKSPCSTCSSATCPSCSLDK